MDKYLAFAAQYDPEGVESLILARNASILYRFALSDRERPGMTWAQADFAHASIARALKVDPSDPTSQYALAPFGLARIDGHARILAAWPCPAFLGDTDLDWLGIETVLAWNPVNDRVDVLGEARPGHLVGAFDGTDRGTLYASPFAFFRAWLEQRAQFLTRYASLKAAHWSTPPVERDHPGVLMVGRPDQITWRPSELPELLEVQGDRDDVFKSIFRAAGLPRVVAANNLRIAA